ncbi:ABC transporter ATP-binding protein [Paenibacillus sp. MBLB4367]|uniref:ABC transporter ATP-binding protein n=1 Tax=Paenibacillus sp. MBLB4367 TaxID=3384767 RepID=UPI003907F059
MSDVSTVLSVRGITKTIKNKQIIKGISFDVYAGEVFGFLGPNGAGKTTTIRMLVDLIKPTTGTISICGVPVGERPNDALRNIGCIVENPELYSYLSGWENLEHFARMLPDVDDARIREVVAIVGMDKRIYDKVRTYSLGMRQRLGIAQALLGRPRLLILDEPTNGLDPQGIKEMRVFIRNLAKDGLSVFVSSHLLSEIQLMCDRVAIISHGSVIAVGEVSELLSRSEASVVWRAVPAERALAVLRQSGWNGTVRETEAGPEPDGLSLTAASLGTAGPERTTATAEKISAARIATIDADMPQHDIPRVNRLMVEADVDVYAITVYNPTLEDLFLRLTEGETID